MVISTTRGGFGLRSRLQVFIFHFLVPLVGKKTFVCVKDPVFYVVDKSFKDTFIVLKCIINDLFLSAIIYIAAGSP